MNDALNTDEKTWLIWDTRTTVGNCVLFWGPDGKGYVCDLREAGRYTEAEAKAQAKSRHTDLAVPLALAEELVCHHVRADGALQEALDKAGLPNRPTDRRDDGKRWAERRRPEKRR